MSAEQAINDKLQGSVATYLRCGGVVDNQILVMFIADSVSEFFFKSMNIWGNVTSKSMVVSYTLRAWPTRC